VNGTLRGRGFGRALVERTLERMAAAGMGKANIMVFAHNADGHAFWERLGWSARADLELRQIDLNSAAEVFRLDREGRSC
jgi:GNAT superfamily N-acetyltransferase